MLWVTVMGAAADLSSVKRRKLRRLPRCSKVWRGCWPVGTGGRWVACVSCGNIRGRRAATDLADKTEAMGEVVKVNASLHKQLTAAQTELEATQRRLGTMLAERDARLRVRVCTHKHSPCCVTSHRGMYPFSLSLSVRPIPGLPSFFPPPPSARGSPQSSCDHRAGACARLPCTPQRFGPSQQGRSSARQSDSARQSGTRHSLQATSHETCVQWPVSLCLDKRCTRVATLCL